MDRFGYWVRITTSPAKAQDQKLARHKDSIREQARHSGFE